MAVQTTFDLTKQSTEITNRPMWASSFGSYGASNINNMYSGSIFGGSPYSSYGMNSMGMMGNNMYGMPNMYGGSIFGGSPYSGMYGSMGGYGMSGTTGNTNTQSAFESNGYGASANEDPSLWSKPEWATKKVYTNKEEYNKAMNEWANRNDPNYIYKDNDPDKGVKTSFKSEKEMMDTLDTDGDGAVNETEAKAYQKALKDSGVKKVDIAGKDFNVVDSNKKKVKGTKGNDLIFAGENAKKIKGKGGDDIIFAFGDAKKVKGGKGNDSIKTFGNVGKIKGGKGKDFVTAYGDVNKLKGGKGDDLIKAFGDVNKIKGNGGADKIYATGAVDKVKGGYGEDNIFAPNARKVKEDPNKWWKTGLIVVGAVAAVAACVFTAGAASPAIAAAISGVVGTTMTAGAVGTCAVAAAAVGAGSQYALKAGNSAEENAMDKYNASYYPTDGYGGVTG